MYTHDASFFYPAPIEQKFCTQCGSPLSRVVPPLDNAERDTCLNCGAVHYRNPLLVVGTIPIYEDKVLLCRRAIEPRYDKWTFPAGFMELGESTVYGAQRETLEEAGAEVEVGPLFTVIDVPHAHQVHVYYLAKALSDKLDPGIESLEAAYFKLDDIPWDELAFETISSTLRHYVKARENGNYGPFRYTLD